MTETTVLDVGAPVVLAIPFQRIADLVTTCLEGNASNEWLRRAVVGRADIDSKPLSAEYPWYSQGAYWAQPAAALECTVENPVNDHSGWNKGKTIRLQDLQLGLILLATAKDGAYAHHFGNFLANNEDAGTADIFMQMVVYGEEVYA